jgi:hypothetical protein
MNAVVKPKSLLEQIRDDIRAGSPGAHLEAPEVPRWAEEMLTDMTSQLVEAIKWQADDAQLDKFHDLLCECMDEIKADRLIELRDVLRALLLDYSISQAEKILANSR